MTNLVNVVDLPPMHSLTTGVLVDVIALPPHPLLPKSKSRERWVFEIEPEPGRWQLVDCYLLKWKHPQSKRTRFLRQWLGEKLQPEMLDDPMMLVGMAAELDMITSFDSDGTESRWVDAARPATKPIRGSGGYQRLKAAL